MKQYNDTSIAYFDKLTLSKNAGYNSILQSIKNFYSNSKYISVGLNFKSKQIYIADDIVKEFSQTYMKLKGIFNEVPINNIKNFLENEIYNTIYVEQESSSRKAIKMLLNDINHTCKSDGDKLERNLIKAYEYISDNPKFTKENIRTLYGILTTDIDMGVNNLDGTYYRNSEVIIGKYHGVESSLIEEHMNDLISYFNNADGYDCVIRTLIIHTYFEMIHPYYDFNGRMGRLIIFWYGVKMEKLPDLLFFSTAMVHYRDHYIKIFKETQKLQFVDLTYPVVEMLKIMIANKQNYLVLQKIKEFTLNNYKSDLSFIAKDMLMRVLAMRDIYDHKTDSWIDKSTIDEYYKEYAPSVIYNELHKLRDLGIVELTKTKPLKIKFMLSKFINQ